MTIELVDMCGLQNPPDVDFDKMKASGIRGVYFKASQFSHDRDVTYGVGVRRAREAGLVVGAYHFCYQGSDPVAQMEHFFESADGLGRFNGELPPMIDWEYEKNDASGNPIKKSDSVLWLVKAAAAAAELWYPNGDRLPTIYTYPYFAWMHQPWLSQATELAQYPLTIAAYPTILSNSVPKPWTTATLHQYIGNGGQVPGVASDCDRDRFLGTEDEWRLFLGQRDENLVGSGGIIHDQG